MSLIDLDAYDMISGELKLYVLSPTQPTLKIKPVYLCQGWRTFEQSFKKMSARVCLKDWTEYERYWECLILPPDNLS